PISESETAFLVEHGRPNARTAQHRPDAEASMAGPGAPETASPYHTQPGTQLFRCLRAKGYGGVSIQFDFGDAEPSGLSLRNGRAYRFFQRGCFPVKMNPGHAIAGCWRPIIAT